ncbi:ATP-binding protein [Phytoactinopolyspora halotolerans]|uniref:ATP-binding protein n=1 Tax=Phytoactinopolyspora halotolerans TaxID=1981512 RepID=A0A6L9S1Y2_9ACTN|nr:ATP-binding protein [Phytoactinopolyspora halotolerans]NED98810.1 ATP-binding protein [Phytoactinopolyspora halotolerans]
MPQTATAYRSAEPTQARALELGNVVSSVPKARHAVAADLHSVGVPQSVLDNVLLVVTELVSNAILHAKPIQLSEAEVGVILRWTVSDRHVLIDVTDGGSADTPRVKRPESAEPEGRGLAIVEAVARNWSVRSADDRVTVQAVVGPWEPGNAS